MASKLSPIIPADTADRTGTRGIRRRATAEINKRWAALSREILRIFDRIRVIRINEVEFGRHVYSLTPQEMERVQFEMQAALDRWIASGRDPANFAWFAPYEAEAMQLGTAQAAANLSRLSPAYAATRALQSIVQSQPYRDRLAMAQIRSYEHWTGLSAQLRSELTSVISAAVVDGRNPRAVRTEIAERLGVSRERAALYAQTDITGTLREARLAEAEQTEVDLGIKTGLLWTSALKPTTRPWHASRHGRSYSPAEVRSFYSERGNRFTCYCATTECLLDSKGQPILSDAAKKGLAREKAAWVKAHGR